MAPERWAKALRGCRSCLGGVVQTVSIPWRGSVTTRRGGAGEVTHHLQRLPSVPDNSEVLNKAGFYFI